MAAVRKLVSGYTYFFFFLNDPLFSKISLIPLKKWKLKDKLKSMYCQWKDSQVNICVRAATDSGVGCALHKRTTFRGGILNITDIKDLLIYYDRIPVDGSVLRKGVFKKFTITHQQPSLHQKSIHWMS